MKYAYSPLAFPLDNGPNNPSGTKPWESCQLLAKDMVIGPQMPSVIKLAPLVLKYCCQVVQTSPLVQSLTRMLGKTKVWDTGGTYVVVVVLARGREPELVPVAGAATVVKLQEVVLDIPA